MSRIDELLAAATTKLGQNGVDEPRRTASSLLSWTLGRDRTFLIAHPEYECGAVEVERFESAVARRSAREPLQQITGTQEFYGLDFEITPDVLIPRPETEIIVAEALAFLESVDEPRVCDVGTGSGCIPIAILSHRRDAVALAADISPRALEVAARNAARHEVAGRIKFVESDVFASVPDEKFDIIVSNPPYIAAAEINSLEPEVRDHEPISALTDGGDGLSIVRQVIDGAAERLEHGGLLLVEIGFGQSAAVERLVDGRLWDDVSFVSDLQGIPRTLRCRRRL